MTDLFIRYREAQIYANALPNIPARTALNSIHHFLLETSGLPLHYLPERYRPIQPLDVLFFFKAVERLFTEWTGDIRNHREIPGNRERLLQYQEAQALTLDLPTDLAQIGLTNFLSILWNTPVPQGTLIDALFCSRLVAILFSNSDLLEQILSADYSWETTNPWQEYD